MEKLVEDDLVLAKVYGKTTIYSVKQQLDAADNTEDLSKTINDLTEKCEELVGENRKLDSSRIYSF